MTTKEEIQKYLTRIKKPFPEDAHGLARELNERQALLARATELKVAAQIALDVARGKVVTTGTKVSVSEYKDFVNAQTVAEREVLDLASGLHSDLVHSCDVGRTLVSMEKQYLRTFPDESPRKERSEYGQKQSGEAGV